MLCLVTGPPPEKPKGLTAIFKDMEKEQGNTQPTKITHEQQIDDNKISSYIDFLTAEIETSPLVESRVQTVSYIVSTD